MTDPESNNLFFVSRIIKNFFTLSETLKKNINFSYYHVNHTSRQYWPKNYLDNYAGFVGVKIILNLQLTVIPLVLRLFRGFSKALLCTMLKKPFVIS